MPTQYNNGYLPWNSQDLSQLVAPNTYNALNTPTYQMPDVISGFNEQAYINPTNLNNSAFNMDGSSVLSQPGGGDSPWYGNDAMGALSTGIKGVGSLASLWMSMKNYGLQKEQLKENKRQYNQNYAAQRQSTNTQLMDRQNARVASGSNYQSVGDYMAQNRIV